MDDREFAKVLEKRTLAFAIDVIRFIYKLPATTEVNVIKRQLSKSGTSIGANYREANRSRSRADFINKIRICESEASETQYWLDLIKECELINNDDIDEIYKECTEILALFTSIRFKTKTKQNP